MSFEKEQEVIYRIEINRKQLEDLRKVLVCAMRPDWMNDLYNDITEELQ